MNTNHDQHTGQFSSGHDGDAAARQPQNGAPSGRYPVGPHVGARSVASHRGGNVVSAFNERHMRFEPVASGKRTAVMEAIAKNIRSDGGFAKISK
jgi:hypothetical protein